MNQKQFKKKFPTASFDMMAEEAIASAELAGANSKWEIRFEELKKHFFVEDVKQFISDEIAKAKQEGIDEVLSLIEKGDLPLVSRLIKEAKQEGAEEMLKIISEDFGWKSIQKYYLNRIKL